MTVIALRPRADHRIPGPLVPGRGMARIQGSFRSPRGGAGTMTGWLRLGGFVVVSGQLCAAGVFTGELLDADGTTIGVGSRRRTAPVEIARTDEGITALVGPVEVDLLGLTVTVPAFAVEIGARAPSVEVRARDRRTTSRRRDAAARSTEQ
jgi:hypothetical protein